MNRRAFIGTLAGGLLAAPLAAEAQPTKAANEPLSSIVDYALRHGTDIELLPDLVKLLGWTPPIKGKRKGFRNKEGDHHLYLVTERGKTDIVFLLETERAISTFLTSPAGKMERVSHGDLDRGRHSRPAAESLEMFLTETYFWLQKATQEAPATKQ